MNTIQPNSPFSVLPKDIHKEILHLLSVKDLKAMMGINHWHRGVAKKCIRNYKLLEVYRLPPAVNFKEGWSSFIVNELDSWALWVESAPLLGYICSIPRVAGGVLASIGFGIGEGVCYLREKAADNDRDRKARMMQKEYCARQAVRGALNISRGIMHCIPLYGRLLTLEANPKSVYLDHDMEMCMKSCHAALKALDWIAYVSKHVCPMLPKLNRRSIKEVLDNREVISGEIERWNRRGQRFLKRTMFAPNYNYSLMDWKLDVGRTRRIVELVFDQVKELKNQIEQGILAK